MDPHAVLQHRIEAAQIIFLPCEAGEGDRPKGGGGGEAWRRAGGRPLHRLRRSPSPVNGGGKNGFLHLARDDLAVHDLDDLAGRQAAHAPEDRLVGQGVVEGQQFARAVRRKLGADQAGGQEGARLRGEGDRALVLQQVERLDAERVARQPGAPVRADQAEGVHAAQAVEGGGPFLGVEVQQGLEVRAGGELVLQVELLGQFDIVVDLAVADNGRARAMQGLPAACEVDDRQARMGERAARRLLHEDAVRSAVLQGFDHGAGRAAGAEHAGDGAHQAAP